MEVGVGTLHFSHIKDTLFFAPIILIDTDARMQIAEQICAS
jgi:hypothetical protein